jgi:hypothetical protein
LKLQNWVLELWSNYETATASTPPSLSRRPYSGDGKPPRERPYGPVRPWFCSEPRRPGSSSACHAPMVTWTAATTPAMRHAAQTTSPLAVAYLRPCPAESTSPGWRTALPGAPSLSFTAYKTTPSPLARPDPIHHGHWRRRARARCGAASTAPHCLPRPRPRAPR